MKLWMAKAIFMIPVMFHLTRGKKVQVELVEIDKNSVTKDSDEIRSAVQEFRRQGWEVREIFIPKKVNA
jgi:hypothetical protein